MGERGRERGGGNKGGERARRCGGECLMTLGSKENFYSCKPALYTYRCSITV